MVQVIWTDEALSWLGQIKEYISNDSPASAERVVRGIYEKSLLLGSFPRLGYRHEAILDREVRVLLYGRYQIAYLVEEEDAVRILGVFHSAMNLTDFLR